MIDVEVRDRVAVITLNQPDKLNALSGGAIGDLSAAYERLDRDDEVVVIVLTGAGRAFCSGADLSRPGGAFQAPADRPAFRSAPPHPWAFEIRKPVLAAINGHAIGLGMTIALHADIRVIADEAKWGVVQARRGVVGDAVSHWTLARAVGLARAAEVLLTGRLFTGPEAVAMGVASRALPAGEVLPFVMDTANEMVRECSPLSLAFSKRILWAAADTSAPAVDDLESAAHSVLMGAPDALEGGAAAFEKRAPQWTSSVPRDWPATGPFAT